MKLNEAQKQYLVSLVTLKHEYQGYDINDKTIIQSISEASQNLIDVIENSNNQHEVSELLLKLGEGLESSGTEWSELVSLGDDDWLKEQQQQNADNLNNAVFIDGYHFQKAAYEYHEVQAEKQPVNIDALKEYGNNYFELTTYDRYLNSGKGGVYTLAGVLKEIPSFSMSTTWEKGPASTISDTVKSFMCSSLMEIVTTIGGHDRSWMNLDEGTDRVYASTGRPSFSLNFKLYTNDNIGSQQLSTWKTWLRALSMYATPSVDAKVNITSMAENAIYGIWHSIDAVNQAAAGFREGFSGDDKDQKREAFDKVIEGITKAVDDATGYVAKRDGPKRVETTANSENFYGSKLWYLRILPGIFKKPLIVYISNWGVTYSKEMNFTTKEPIWIEFKITCEMDQIASAPVWMNYLT